MTLQPWRPDPEPRDIIDGWAPQVAAIMELAGIVGDSAFVPDAYREAGGAAAVAAAILTGRELGIGPMTSLAHLHVIKGRPGMSAQLMRALVLAHGHHLRIPEMTGTTCTIIGRRADETDELAITWTMDMARAARLTGNPTWAAYPRAMLFARATGELCRAKFADIIGGMAYTAEELADIDTPEPPPQRSTRTLRRAPTVEAAPEPPPRPEPPQVPPAPQRPPSSPQAGGTPPPLPDIPAEPQNRPLPAEQPTPGTSGRPDRVEPPAADDDGPVAITSAQRAMLMAQLGDLRLREPPRTRHHVLSGLAGRRITGTNQLTREQASAIIDTLARRLEEQMTPLQFDELVEAGWAGIND